MSSPYEKLIKHKILTLEDEKALWRRMSRGDEAARHELVSHNIRFVGMLASDYIGMRKGGLTAHEDLVGEGILALYEATKKFDPRKGPFVPWARLYVMRAFSDYGRSIGFGSVNVSRNVRKVSPPVFDYLSAHDGKRAGNDNSIEAEMTEMAHQIGDAGALPERNSDLATLSGALKDGMQALPARSRKILAHRFGLNGKKPELAAEIGKRMKRTRQGIMYTEAQSLNRLKEVMARSGYTSMAC